MIPRCLWENAWNFSLFAFQEGQLFVWWITSRLDGLSPARRQKTTSQGTKFLRTSEGRLKTYVLAVALGKSTLALGGDVREEEGPPRFAGVASLDVELGT